jgi:hypothetical protein
MTLVTSLRSAVVERIRTEALSTARAWMEGWHF